MIQRTSLEEKDGQTLRDFGEPIIRWMERALSTWFGSNQDVLTVIVFTFSVAWVVNMLGALDLTRIAAKCSVGGAMLFVIAAAYSSLVRVKRPPS